MVDTLNVILCRGREDEDDFASVLTLLTLEDWMGDDDDVVGIAVLGPTTPSRCRYLDRIRDDEEAEEEEP